MEESSWECFGLARLRRCLLPPSSGSTWAPPPEDRYESSTRLGSVWTEVMEESSPSLSVSFPLSNRFPLLPVGEGLSEALECDLLRVEWVAELARLSRYTEVGNTRLLFLSIVCKRGLF